MPTHAQIADDMIKDLQHPRQKLTPWELQFLENVDDQLGRTGSLSRKQRETLEKIWKEKA